MITTNLLGKPSLSIVSGLTVAILGLGGFMPDRASADSGIDQARVLPATVSTLPVHRGHHGNICVQVARAARRASMYEAREDFLLSVASCISRGESYMDCLPDAWEEFREAQDLAHEQYEARLEVCELVGCGVYNPDLNPELFDSVVDNDFFPLIPGRTLVYRKVGEEGEEIIRVTTLAETIEIGDIECSEVMDIVEIDGVVVEDTRDWFAQHENGDVYYVGEIAKNFEDGRLKDLDGSWESGEDGALAGVIMKAEPCPGDGYRQEFFLDEAEDIGEVISLNETVTVAYGTFTGCLQTRDSSPLEPGNAEHKFYASGIGVVLEIDLESGERLELIDIINN